MELTNLVVNRTAENIAKAFGDDIEKARHGVYSDTAENRRLRRVGQEYGSKKSEEAPKGRPQAKQQEQKDERFSADGIIGKDGSFNKQGASYKRWAALREKVETGKATPEEKKEFAHIHNQYLNEKSRNEYERKKVTDPNAQEPKYETVEERTARVRGKKEEGDKNGGKLKEKLGLYEGLTAIDYETMSDKELEKMPEEVKEVLDSIFFIDKDSKYVAKQMDFDDDGDEWSKKMEGKGYTVFPMADTFYAIKLRKKEGKDKTSSPEKNKINPIEHRIELLNDKINELQDKKQKLEKERKEVGDKFKDSIWDIVSSQIKSEIVDLDMQQIAVRSLDGWGGVYAPQYNEDEDNWKWRFNYHMTQEKYGLPDEIKDVLKNIVPKVTNNKDILQYAKSSKELSEKIYDEYEKINLLEKEKSSLEKMAAYGDIGVEAEEFLDNSLYTYAIGYAEQSYEILNLMYKLKTERYTHPAVEEEIVNYVVNIQGEEFSSQIKKLCEKYGKDKVRDLLIKENPGDASVPKKTMAKIVRGLINKYGK